MEMTEQLSKTLEKAFLDEIGTFMGPCICKNVSCENLMYKFVGKASSLEYILEYDPKLSEDEAINIQIYIQENDYVVFNGRCYNNHDLAQALRMTVI